MKIPCHVVEDLLPLYHDGVCSQESSAVINEHLRECDSCSKILSQLEVDIAPVVVTRDDTAPMKMIRDKWRKSKKRAFLKGTAIALAVCGVLIGVYLGLTQWKFIPVPADLLEITEVSQLSDGQIIYHLEVKDDKNLYFIKFTTNEDGSFYITPMRSIIEGKRNMEHGLFKDYFMVDIAENNAYQQNHGEGIVITSCYIGPQDHGILIWEHGMELPKASQALEEMVN